MKPQEIDAAVLSVMDKKERLRFSDVNHRLYLKLGLLRPDVRKIDRSLQRLRKRGSLLLVRGKGGGWVKT